MLKKTSKKLFFTIILLTVFSISGCLLLSPVDKSKYSDLKGFIYSVETKRPLKDVEVKIIEQSTSTNTNKNGFFIIRGMPIDWVTLKITTKDYQEITRKVKIEPYGTKHIEVWLPKNKQTITEPEIVFERNGEIWLTDEFGINQANISNKKAESNNFYGKGSEYSFTSPYWLSNKNKIAYLVLNNSINPKVSNGVWTMNKSGKMKQRVTYIDSKAKGLSVSKDSNYYIYSMLNPDNTRNLGLYLFNQKMGKNEKITANIGMDYSPSWSNDGSKIVYTSTVTVNPMMNTYNANQYVASRPQIFIMNKKGFQKKQLTDSGENYDPSWSPDGSKIAFISNRTGSSELWVMNSDGSGQRKVTTTNAKRANNPRWSKDGRNIIFNTSYKQKYNSIYPSELWLFSFNSYSLRMVSNDAISADW